MGLSQKGVDFFQEKIRFVKPDSSFSRGLESSFYCLANQSLADIIRIIGDLVWSRKFSVKSRLANAQDNEGLAASKASFIDNYSSFSLPCSLYLFSNMLTLLLGLPVRLLGFV